MSIIDQNPAAEKQSEGSNNNKRKKEEDSNHAYDDDTDKEDGELISPQANDQKQSTNSPQYDINKRRKVSISPDSVKSEVLEDTDDEEVGTKLDGEADVSNGSVQKANHMTCSVEGCNRKAADSDSGTCKTEHGGYKYCKHEGCITKW